MKYQQAREDFEALECIAELDDQICLDDARLNLMQNPTKKTAMAMYVNGILLWFEEHGVMEGTEQIAERYVFWLLDYAPTSTGVTINELE